MSSAGYHHYNPDWLTDDALVANFIARMDEFTFLRHELARVPLLGTVQHYLLVGLRGSGKTTLLKRLAVAIRRDAELKNHLIALSFPEELYQVKNLADFWWACCDALADELEHLKQSQQADQLLDNIEQTRANKPASDAGLQLLQTTCAGLQRRPILLVDNLDLVFQRIGKTGRKVKDPHASAYWELREALSTTHAPMVIGGSVRLSEPFTDYDKAFYDFFMPKHLGKLSLEEVKKVLNHLAETQHAPEIKQRLQERPARIAALFELTGGNLRALGLIFELLRQGPNGRAVEDFERLMDSTTPYYKARFEDLPEQAQVVMHALAVRPLPTMRFGHTAAEIARHIDLPTSSVSAQMEILIREGLVEKTAAHGRTQYRIAEQLFRLWLQMRSTRRVRQNVLGLTAFFEALFDQEEIQAQMNNADHASALSEGKFCFAIAGTRHAAPLRQGLEAQGTDCILQHLDEHGGKLNDFIVPGDLPEALEKTLQLREQLRQCNGGDLNAQQQEALLGSLRLSHEQKQASVDALCQKTTAQQELARLQPLLQSEQQYLLRYGLKENDLAILFRKRAQGLLPLPWLTPQDIESATAAVSNQSEFKAMVWRLLGARGQVEFANDPVAQDWLAWGLEHASDASSTEWANVAGAMLRSQRYQPAQQTLEQAFARGNTSRAWFERAVLLAATDSDLIGAEEACREAIKTDATDAWPWNGLALLLTKELNRHDEAEVAYRKAIAIDPTYALPWSNLGYLLTEKLNRHDEAEVACRKAIELDPTLALPWNDLANLLTNKLNRHDEAETAYRKAIKLAPINAGLWNNLANLLANKLNRHDEAETALRKAIELDPTLVLSWNNLAALLTGKFNRHDEAETALRKAIELNPTLALSWSNLAILLTGKFNRHDEAETALRKAIELDPTLALSWSNLAILLTEKLNRHDEAETAFRKAIKLDPTLALSWSNLAFLLTEKLNRHDEAEAAFRKAIELDPTLALVWHNLGQLLDKQNRLDEASAAFNQWAALDADPHPWRKLQRANLQIRLCREAMQQALETLNFTALQNALTRLLDESADIATSLVSEAFVEELLAPLLSNQQHAEAVLDAMHQAGYKKHARPMLLAFEAALHDQKAMLGELEPEIQTATKRMFERLINSSHKRITD